MDDSAKVARREYQRAWRAAHKEKVSAYNRAYWERRAKRMQEIDTSERQRTGEGNE